MIIAYLDSELVYVRHSGIIECPFPPPHNDQYCAYVFECDEINGDIPRIKWGSDGAPYRIDDAEEAIRKEILGERFLGWDNTNSGTTCPR